MQTPLNPLETNNQFRIAVLSVSQTGSTLGFDPGGFGLGAPPTQVRSPTQILDNIPEGALNLGRIFKLPPRPAFHLTLSTRT